MTFLPPMFTVSVPVTRGVWNALRPLATTERAYEHVLIVGDISFLKMEHYEDNREEITRTRLDLHVPQEDFDKLDVPAETEPMGFHSKTLADCFAVVRVYNSDENIDGSRGVNERADDSRRERENPNVPWHARGFRRG